MNGHNTPLPNSLASGRQFGTILADPPWRFMNRTGKMAPEHRRLLRYSTMKLEDIVALPVKQCALQESHLYMWVPTLEGLEVMKALHVQDDLVWYKIRKDGGPDGRGVRDQLVLSIEVEPGRRQVNIIRSRKREHSRKPDELYDVIEACSPGPYLELFARHPRDGWTQWGDEIGEKVFGLEPPDPEVTIAPRLLDRPESYQSADRPDAPLAPGPDQSVGVQVIRDSKAGQTT